MYISPTQNRVLEHNKMKKHVITVLDTNTSGVKELTTIQIRAYSRWDRFISRKKMPPVAVVILKRKIYRGEE
jgi:hypothetical protein